VIEKGKLDPKKGDWVKILLKIGLLSENDLRYWRGERGAERSKSNWA